jgi:hypothetical protein
MCVSTVASEALCVYVCIALVGHACERGGFEGVDCACMYVCMYICVC